MDLDFLKPTDEEIRELADREVTPAHIAEFEPICRGPLVAVLLIAWAGVASLPHMAAAVVRRISTGRPREDHGV